MSPLCHEILYVRFGTGRRFHRVVSDDDARLMMACGLRANRKNVVAERYEEIETGEICGQCQQRSPHWQKENAR